MPWKASDATRFNSGAQSTRVKSLWAQIANETLRRTGDEGRAVRAANAAIKLRGPSHLESKT